MGLQAASRVNYGMGTLSSGWSRGFEDDAKETPAIMAVRLAKVRFLMYIMYRYN